MGRGELKDMTLAELESVSNDIRCQIIQTVTNNGGHLASNLGVIELTVALNYVFDNQTDFINFDVGHQCYAHKILNGRAQEFDTLRQTGGISGFPDHGENNRDSTSSGHSSTALSLSLGQAAALKLRADHQANNQNSNQADHQTNKKNKANNKNKDNKNEDMPSVVAIVGDGAFTGGEAFEALNNIQQIDYPITVILNDNQMSIGKNVGAINRHLSKIRVSTKYIRLKKRVEKILTHTPILGRPLLWLIRKMQRFCKAIFTKKTIFEHFGLKYVGIIDGQSLPALIKILQKIKKSGQKVLLHIETKKGSGFKDAEAMPEKFHGVNEGLIGSKNEISRFVGESVLKMAQTDEKVCVVAAAMLDGTGFSGFAEALPHRTFDVGIAEQHALTFASGLCGGGFKPYVAIYSTFLQRAIDQIIVDVCINSLPVVLLVDRCGVSGHDGKTHNGIFDVSYLSMIPNLTILSPKDKRELERALKLSRDYDAPLAIRYSNAYDGELYGEKNVEFDGEKEANNDKSSDEKDKNLGGENAENKDENREFDSLFDWELLYDGGNQNVVFSYSNAMLRLCLTAAKQLKKQGIGLSVVNARNLSKTDENMLARFNNSHIMVVEDQIKSGSLGSKIAHALAEKGITARFNHLCLNEFIPHGSTAALYEAYGLTTENIIRLFA